MNINTKRTGIFTALMLVLACSAVTLRTVACMNELEYSYGYFTDKTLIHISTGVAVISCLALFSYAFLSNKVELRASFSTPITYIPTGLVGVGLIFAARALFHYADTSAPINSMGDGSPDFNIILATATGALAILSVLHFFLNAFVTEQKTELRAFFSLCTILYLGLYATYLYFNTTLPLNAPNKLTDQMAYLFAALFFLYEARISLGREKWRGYVTIGLIAAFLCAYSSVPSLIVYIAKEKVISASIEESVLTLTLFIFILSRLVLVMMLPERGESKLANAVSSYAEHRKETVTETSRLRQEAYAVQLTIDDLLGGEINDEKPDEPSKTSEEAEEVPLIEDAEEQVNIFDTEENQESEEENNITDKITEISFEELMGFAPLPTHSKENNEDEAQSDDTEANVDESENSESPAESEETETANNTDFENDTEEA